MRPDETSEMDRLLDGEQFRAMMTDEFPEDAAQWLDPVSRRQFVTIMGASVALATGVGCNPSFKPASQKAVMPYVHQPDEILPGIPIFFSTSYPGQSGVSQGLLVKQTEGRPIKVEGNPSHPGSLGGTDLISQGTVLGLYDPDRSRAVQKKGTPYGYDKFLDETKQLLDAQKPSQGAGVRFLTEPTTSPTLIAQVEEFLKRYPKAKWIQYEPVGRDSVRRAALAAFGKYVNPVYKLDKAQVVLALDCDFLSAAGVGNVRYSRDFMANRKVRMVEESVKRGEGIPLEKMNRLYAVESMVTSTGAVADHRLPLPPSQVEAVARAVAAKLGVAGVAAPALGESQAWVEAMAADLLAHKGTALVMPGDTQPAAVHLLAHAINEKLGAFGQTVVFTEPLEARPADGLAELVALADDLSAGKVELLFVMNVNPAYDAPADLDFAKRMAASKATKIHLGLYEDETAALGRCDWHVNAAHYLETWGDARAYDGTVAIQQPLISPLFGGKSPYDVFASLLDQPTNEPLELVKATWKKYFDDKVKKGDFAAWWEGAVRDGVVPGTAFEPVTVAAVNLEKLTDANFATPKPKGGVEVQFRPDLTLWDGRFANNGWLQELPKPITTLSWDCAAMMSPALAEKLGLENWFAMTGGEHGHTVADVVSVKLDGRTLSAIPVLILPGHADDAVTLHLGHGRDPRYAGKVAAANPSFNVYQLRTTTAYWSLGGAEVAQVPGEEYPLGVAQGHTAMEGRRPARHATAAQFKKERDFAQIPAASAGEYKIIRSQTPGTPEDMERLGLENPYELPEDHPHEGHEHGHTEEGGHHGAGTAADHDPRIIPLSMYPKYPQPYMGVQATKSYRRWGLSIDLGACTGCSACVIACVSEVNTPVIGKSEILRGRAMHWLRVDRYFSIPGEKIMEDELGANGLDAKTRAERSKLNGRIRTHVMPLMCVNCEKAPCETVCPVGATVHSADGLNDMVYNRCVGTRYCSNNCPYKVRRFNFIQYTDYNSESMKLVNNPEVTVRTRGVMEKCTYCTQRIRNAEIVAEREHDKRKAAGQYDFEHDRPRIVDGEVVTACQGACPTRAIVFGDINDPKSAVLRAKAEPHAYGLLAELAVAPRTTHLAAIRNPNPAMPKGV